MKRIRVIPGLLMQNGGLVKSIKFKDHKYVGDPINAVKIFNEKGVDEIVILDRTAGANGPNIARIKDIASEAFMPMGYGGGISNLDQIKQLISSGVEKVILNTHAYNNPNLVSEGARYVGSQSIVASIDIKRNLFGKYKVFIENGTRSTGVDPVEYAKRMVMLGAGEILLTSIDRDGTFLGYDDNLIHQVSAAVDVPVIASGGGASVLDFQKAVQSGASAVAAGSMFVFQGPHRAVLISYPSQTELKEKLFSHFN